MTTRDDLERLTRQLADSGKLIESGWVSMRLACIPLDAPQVQIDEMRNAFMTGALHLYGSMVTFMDSGEVADIMRRTELIVAELDAFGKELQGRLRKPGSPQ